MYASQIVCPPGHTHTHTHAHARNTSGDDHTSTPTRARALTKRARPETDGRSAKTERTNRGSTGSPPGAHRQSAVTRSHALLNLLKAQRGPTVRPHRQSSRSRASASPSRSIDVDVAPEVTCSSRLSRPRCPRLKHLVYTAVQNEIIYGCPLPATVQSTQDSAVSHVLSTRTEHGATERGLSGRVLFCHFLGKRTLCMLMGERPNDRGDPGPTNSAAP